MKRIIIFILAILLLAAGTLYFYAKKYHTPTPVGVVDTFKSFFPLGGDSGAIPDGVIQDSPNTTAGTTTPTSPFKQLSNGPIAGYTLFTRKVNVTIPSEDPTAKPLVQSVVEHVIRYVSRASGFVFEIKERDGVTELPLQITNIFIPNIYEASFIDNNSSALLRFLRNSSSNTISTYLIPIPEPNPDDTRTQKEGIYLPDDIRNIAVSPDQIKFARLSIDQSGGFITTSTSLNGLRTEVVRTPFREWLLSWQNSGLYVQTKASAYSDGFLYSVNQTEKRLKKVLGNIPGLTASVSPNGTYILYSESTNNNFITKLFNTKTNTTKVLSLKILPEKCTWLKNEDLLCAGNTDIPNVPYPDAWYAGVSKFSDNLYRIYTSVATYDVVYDGTERVFDMTNLRVEEDQNTVLFVDKTSGYLWQYKI